MESRVFLTGSNDNEIEGTWANGDGSSTTLLELNWSAEEPNGGQGENCAVWFAEHEVSADYPCSHATNTICEREADPASHQGGKFL